jgi:2',3'-cyclic-nucleotide 2'-phosphodiesterase (5'-nucleotidase family)
MVIFEFMKKPSIVVRPANVSFRINREILRSYWCLAAVVICSLLGCNVTNAEDGPSFKLQILHFSDIDGDTITAMTVEANRFARAIAHYRSQFPDNTLVLSSGDNWLPGATYSAGSHSNAAKIVGVPGNGRLDVAFLNAIGVQASCFGNHEFDLGPEAVFEAIAREGKDGRVWDGAKFPYLSANLDFSSSSSGLQKLCVPDGLPPKHNSIAKSVVCQVAGDSVGIIGVTTPFLTNISNPGDVVVAPKDSSGKELAAFLQPTIDDLRKFGVNKIILLAHLQKIDFEIELAKMLDGVDILIAGGSNTYFKDGNDRPRADQPTGKPMHYPLVLQSTTNEPIYIVNTDADLRYLGRLVVEFDSHGILIVESLNEVESGAYPTDERGLQELGIADVKTDGGSGVVSAIQQFLADYLQEMEGLVVGSSDCFLEGRKAIVRTQETNLGNLTADADLWYARQKHPDVSFCVKNSGGIRSSIGQTIVVPGETDGASSFAPTKAIIDKAGRTIKAAGGISRVDIEAALRFNHGLCLITTDAKTVKEMFEVAFSQLPQPSGGFPQVSGVVVKINENEKAGNRVTYINVIGSTKPLFHNGSFSTDAVTFVTNEYVAKGGDKYPLADLNAVSLGSRMLTVGNATFAADGTEQDSLAEYLLNVKKIACLNLAEKKFRIQFIKN